MARLVLTPQERDDLDRHKKMMRGAIAAAAPGLGLIVAAFSVRTLPLLENLGLGSMGLACLGVVFFCLAFLLKRARWWAGLPALILAALGAAYFAKAFLRPLILYYQVNEIKGLGDILEPVFFMSVPLVGVALCLTVAVVIWTAVKQARSLEPQKVPLSIYVAILVWLAIAGADYTYQNYLWASWGDADDYIYRMCYGDEKQKDTALQHLLQLGPAAAPVLVDAISISPERVDAEAQCLRESGREVLLMLGRAAEPALRQAAEKGNRAAADLLAQRGSGGG